MELCRITLKCSEGHPISSFYWTLEINGHLCGTLPKCSLHLTHERLSLGIPPLQFNSAIQSFSWHLLDVLKRHKQQESRFCFSNVCEFRCFREVTASLNLVLQAHEQYLRFVRCSLSYKCINFGLVKVFHFLQS